MKDSPKRDCLITILIIVMLAIIIVIIPEPPNEEIVNIDNHSYIKFRNESTVIHNHNCRCSKRN